MKHRLTIEERLTGARKALAKLERMGPRYRGLVAGMKKNIRNLEEHRDRGVEFMPYKDRETYLRKQREFHARRKARAQSSRVNSKIPLTPANSYIQKTDSQKLENRPPVSGKRVPIQPLSGVIRASVPLTPLTPQVAVQKHRALALAPKSDPNKGIVLRFEPAAKEKFQVDDCGNARRIVGPDEA
jgi:hypothetical protein